MAYELRKPKWPWRDFLTTQESERIIKIEASTRRSPQMQVDLERIRNRAIGRARYARTRDGVKK